MKMLFCYFRLTKNGVQCARKKHCFSHPLCCLGIRPPYTSPTHTCGSADQLWSPTHPRLCGTCIGETAAAGAVLTGIPLRGLLGVFWTARPCPAPPAKKTVGAFICCSSSEEQITVPDLLPFRPLRTYPVMPIRWCKPFLLFSSGVVLRGGASGKGWLNGLRFVTYKGKENCVCNKVPVVRRNRKFLTDTIPVISFPNFTDWMQSLDFHTSQYL